MRPYQDERDNEEMCGNTTCRWFYKNYDQNCACEEGGEPAVMTCSNYKPVINSSTGLKNDTFEILVFDEICSSVIESASTIEQARKLRDRNKKCNPDREFAIRRVTKEKIDSEDGIMETIEQLVGEHRGYKFLKKGNISPYKNYRYDLKRGQVLVTDLDTNQAHDCGKGWNLATLKWIINNQNVLQGKIVEFVIPDDAWVVIPNNTDGKFRTDKIVFKKSHGIKRLLPTIWQVSKKIKGHCFINPIQATKMPDESKIKNILAQLQDQFWDQLKDQFWDQFRDQFRDQLGYQFRNQLWDQIEYQIRTWNQFEDQFEDQLRDQLGDQLWDQLWGQLWDQLQVLIYFLMKEFVGLKFDHPAFELFKLGVLIIKVADKFKIFGKNGKYLGEI